MTTGSWLRNSRGEWYVVTQFVLTVLLIAAPRVEAGSIQVPRFAGTVGTLFIVVGLLGLVLGALALGRKNLSPFPKPRAEATLIEGGVFSVVRHPIYSGFIFFAFGWSLFWSSGAALVVALALLVLFDLKARREERWLEERFPSYRLYRVRVRKLIPFVY